MALDELCIQILAWQTKFALMRGAETVAVERYQHMLRLAGGALPLQTYWAYLDVAHARTRLGRLDEALPLWERGLQGGRETGHESMLAYGTAGPGLVALQKGNASTAEAYFKESLTIAASFGHRRDQTLALEWLAQAEALQDRPERGSDPVGRRRCGAPRRGVSDTNCCGRPRRQHG